MRFSFVFSLILQNIYVYVVGNLGKWAKFHSISVDVSSPPALARILKVIKNFSTGKGPKNQKFPNLRKFPSKELGNITQVLPCD